jgi:predicted SAM-dependent methyltransferase
MNLTALHISVLETIKHLILKHPELKPMAQKMISDSTDAQQLQNLIQPLINKYCVGQGLEIGAGRNPYCNPETTKFLDKYTENADATSAPDFISDAHIVPCDDESFDYVMSSHVLEHMQDAIGALKEWIRVLKKDGTLFLVLPHADRTFDKHREKTTLEHHIRDHETLTSEPDTSHNQEIKEGWSKLDNFEQDARLYEQKWGAEVWDFEFRLQNGVIHFHVWTQNEIASLVQYLGLKIIWVSEILEERPDSFIVICKKV